MSCGLVLCVSWGQDQPRQSGASGRILETPRPPSRRDTDLALGQDDRLSVIAAALDSKAHPGSEGDCSHLVHSIYERAGFSYPYAPSGDLYAGVEGFERITRPQTGDLVVWRGHAGIIIKPSQHLFFSFLRSGPGIDDYETSYWKSRGRPRFFRYIKNEGCAGCESVGHRSHELVKIKK
jgi:cell wall-associated NlpC family hydrolase